MNRSTKLILWLLSTACSLMTLGTVWADLPADDVQKIRDAAPDKAFAAPAKARKLLVFTLCNGYKHSSIPYCTKALQVIGEKTGAFDIVVSDDMSMFQPENLKQFDALCLNNTTQLKLNPAQKEALLDFVKSGKGLVGIHAATDNFYDWPDGAAMLGGQFDGHPWRAEGTWRVKIDDPDHPVAAPFQGKDFDISDEIYRIKNFSRQHLRVLVSLDLSNKTNRQVKDLRPTDTDVPISWVRSYGAGRVFYCSLGHNHDVCWNPAVLGHYLAGIQFALGDLRADTTNSFDNWFKDIAAYQPGQSRRSLAALDEYLRTIGDKPDLLRTVEMRCLGLLRSKDATDYAKQYACRKLSIIGTSLSVPVLSRMLTQEPTSQIDPADIARYALERIPGDRAASALRNALARTTGKKKVGIINSLGNRRDANCVADFAGLIDDADPEVQAAAVNALGKIADEAATRVLVKALQRTSGALRRAVLDAYLNCADNFLAAGNKKVAAKIYSQLAAKEMPSPIRVAALRGSIAAVRANRAARIIASAAADDDPAVRAAAIKLSRTVKHRRMTTALASLLKKLPNDGKIQVLAALADRRDYGARDPVVHTAKTATGEVRTAALAALGALGDGSTVELLAEAAAESSGAQQQAARRSLYRITGPNVNRTILNAIGQAEAPVKIELLRSLGPRNITQGIDLLLQTAAEDKDPDVRRVSLSVLAELAEPKHLTKLMQLLVNAKTDAERSEAENTVAVVARKIEDPSRRAQPVLAFLASVRSPAGKAGLLNALGRIGDPAALGALKAALADSNAQVRLAAIRVLSQWRDDTPAPELLNVARGSADQVERTLALRGYIRLVGLQGDRSPDRTTAMYKRAMELATADQEKKMILSGLANVRDVAALQMAADYLSQPNLQQEAATAVLRIAERLRKTHPDQTTAALKKLIEAVQDQSLRDRARKLLNRTD